YALVGAGLTFGLTAGLAAVGSGRLRSEMVFRSNSVASGLTLTMLTTLTVGAALRAAAAVSRERERRTLDGLLVLPAGPAAVASAKWSGSVLRGRWLALALV